MENNLFALLAIGALCLDIILCRNIFDEIREEGNKLKNQITALKIPPGKKEGRKLLDLIETQINKLENTAKEAHSTQKIWPFFWTILILSMSIIVLYFINLVYKSFPNNWLVLGFYGTTVKIIDVLWILILLFYTYQIYNILKIYHKIKQEKEKIINGIHSVIQQIKIKNKDFSGFFE